MILTDADIRNEISGGTVLDVGDIEAQLQASSLDLRLASDAFLIESDEVIDAVNPQYRKVRRRPNAGPHGNGGKIIVRPGELLLCSTIETIDLSYGSYINKDGSEYALVGVVSGRSTLGRLGLGVHVTAGFVDPGFKGTITLEVTNVGPCPIALTPGQRIAQIYFMKTTRTPLVPYGAPSSNNKYQGQTGPQGARPEKK